MPKVQSTIKKAFSTIEVILSLSILSIVALGAISAISYAYQAEIVASNRIKGAYLAQEALEAMQQLRNDNYNNLTNGTHGLQLSSGSWQLSGSNDIFGNHTRQIEISTIDSTTKQVTATVSWSGVPGGALSITEYLTNWSRVEAISTITLAASIDLSGNQDALEVIINGNYAYVLRDNTSSNFVVLNLTNLTAPTVAATISLSGRPQSFVVSGNYAYVATDSNSQELVIVNIANPNAPVVAGSFNATGNTDASSIAINGTTVYLGRPNGSTPELHILNVLNPLLVVQLSTLNLTGDVLDMSYHSNYLYMATSNNAGELQILNVTNPLSLPAVTNVNLSANTACRSIDIDSATLMLGCDDSNLYSYTITAPTTLSAGGTFATGGVVHDIAIDGAGQNVMIATSNADAELQIIDSANLSTLQQNDFYSAGGTLFGIDVDSGRNFTISVGADNAQEVIIIDSY